MCETVGVYGQFIILKCINCFLTSICLDKVLCSLL